MNIQVYSEQAVKDYVCDTPHINISIRSPGSLEVTLPENKNRLDEIFLEFHDVDDDPKFQGMQKTFSKLHAIRICDFVEFYKPRADTIIVNCEAGISRSAGVAAALSKYYNGEDSFFFKAYLPNRRVYRIMLETLFVVDVDYTQFEKNIVSKHKINFT